MIAFEIAGRSLTYGWREAIALGIAFSIVGFITWLRFYRR